MLFSCLPQVIPMPMNKGVIYTLLFSFLVVWFYSNTQRETIEPTKGAIDYYWAYQKIKGETPEKEVRWPYNKRTGMPYLASLLPLEARTSFRVINIFSGLLCILFCYKTLVAMGVNKYTQIACLSPMLFYEWSPIRFPFLYAFEANPPAMMLYAIAAYQIVKKNYTWAALAIAISCPIRESGFFFSLVFTLSLLALKEISFRKSIPIFAISFLGLLINRLTTLPLWQPTNPADNSPTAYGTLAYSGSQIEVITYFIKYRFLPPDFGIISSISAILLSLYPCLIGFISNKNRNYFRDPASLISLSFMAIGAIMATFGGKETPRIFFIGYPFYIILMANLIKNELPIKVVFLTLVGLISFSFLGVMTENPHWGWIPSFADKIAGRWVPLPITFFLFWLLVYFICRFTNWENLQKKFNF